ncbi:patatin-like phospholipase domain-containing protein 4 [Pholidichthys leucotaenia]
MALDVTSCTCSEVSRPISFSGSGFLAIYQLGVAQCFQDYAPWILSSAPCILGASAGSLVAAAVACETDLITVRDEILNYAKELKSFALGPLNPSVNVFHWLERMLRKHLSSDAHLLANGRLVVAMTRLSDGKHIMMSEYHSKEDVVQALLCSCFVPGYCGFVPPSFKGIRYLDGGFTSMQPVVPGSSSPTLTVCPFSGESDICPADIPCIWDMVINGITLKGNMANTFRFFSALYPKALESLEQSFYSGYKDGIHFLLSNESLSYNQHSWLVLENTKEEMQEKKEIKTITRLTSLRNNGYMQMADSAKQEPTTYSSLDFDVNVLLGNGVTYLSMFGLLGRIFTYLLLPLMLFYDAVFQNRNSLELLFRQTLEMTLWVWHILRSSLLDDGDDDPAEADLIHAPYGTLQKIVSPQELREDSEWDLVLVELR